MRNECKSFVGYPKESDHYIDVDLNIRIILKLILGKECVTMRTVLN
jgi:hypothetical protein